MALLFIGQNVFLPLSNNCLVMFFFLKRSQVVLTAAGAFQTESPSKLGSLGTKTSTGRFEKERFSFDS